MSYFRGNYPYLLNTIIYYLVNTGVEKNGGSSQMSRSYITFLNKDSGSKLDQNTVICSALSLSLYHHSHSTFSFLNPIIESM